MGSCSCGVTCHSSKEEKGAPSTAATAASSASLRSFSIFNSFLSFISYIPGHVRLASTSEFNLSVEQHLKFVGVEILKEPSVLLAENLSWPYNRLLPGRNLKRSARSGLQHSCKSMDGEAQGKLRGSTSQTLRTNAPSPVEKYPSVAQETIWQTGQKQETHDCL
eukprot:760621-Hanusia_phi.AAC.2